jgi:regulator of cell morphogenesis and NO signaling
MIETKELTLREIVTANPAAIDVFEKYDLDYCCGGAQQLSTAAGSRGVTVEAILSEVERANRLTCDRSHSTDWTKASPTVLIRHIVDTHHSFLRRELPIVDQMLTKVIDAHGRKHGQSLWPLRRMFDEFVQEINLHMRKEENILFPSIVQMESARASGAPAPRIPFGSFANPVRMMELEHELAGWHLEEMREAAGNYNCPPDACETYRELFHTLERVESDLHLHVHLENNILFPAVVRLEAGVSRDSLN